MTLSLINYLTVFLATFIGSVCLTPLARKIALNLNITDSPDGGRKLQRSPVPYLGGLALGLSLSLVVLSGLLIRHVTGRDLNLALSVLIPGILIAFVGFLDDVKALNVAPRLLAQIIAGVITALLSSLGGTYSQLTSWRPLDLAMTILWVVALINSMNFMDNMDGLSSGIALISGTSFFAIAWMNHQYLIAALAIGLAGSCGGFLIFNWSPARIYMGDAGALFLGFILAVLAIRVNLTKTNHAVSLAVPLVLLALPIIDTTTVVFSRIKRGVSPLTGGRDHLSHRCASWWKTRRPGTSSVQANVLAVKTLLTAHLALSAIGVISVFFTL